MNTHTLTIRLMTKPSSKNLTSTDSRSSLSLSLAKIGAQTQQEQEQQTLNRGSPTSPLPDAELLAMRELRAYEHNRQRVRKTEDRVKVKEAKSRSGLSFTRRLRRPSSSSRHQQNAHDGKRSSAKTRAHNALAALDTDDTSCLEGPIESPIDVAPAEERDENYPVAAAALLPVPRKVDITSLIKAAKNRKQRNGKISFILFPSSPLPLSSAPRTVF